MRPALAIASGRLLDAHPGIAVLLVTGSVARGQAIAGTDLDLVAIVDASFTGASVQTAIIEGTRVDTEWLTRAEALAMTQGSGWTWELRRAARLGHGLALHDPSGLAPLLAARSAAMQPDAERFEADLGQVYAALAVLGQGAGTLAERSDMARAVIDNLAHLVLLASPGRYQKPKWVMQDLAALGETGLLAALRAAYGVDDAPEAVLDSVDALVDMALAACGAPPRTELMGHVPDHPGAGLLARTHADAIDMAHAGRDAEAVFIARFAARLALTMGGEAVRAGYDRAFATVPPPSREGLVTILDAADRCTGTLTEAAA